MSILHKANRMLCIRLGTVKKGQPLAAGFSNASQEVINSVQAMSARLDDYEKKLIEKNVIIAGLDVSSSDLLGSVNSFFRDTLCTNVNALEAKLLKESPALLKVKLELVDNKKKIMQAKNKLKND